MDITFDQVEAEVRRLVGENPGFIYIPPGGVGGQCRYLEPNPETGGVRGSCLFGRVFLNLVGEGAIPPLHRDEGNLAESLFATFGVRASETQAGWTAEVQSRQDEPFPWGERLNRADEAYPLKEGQ